MLQNHSCSWRLMFADYRNFAGSLAGSLVYKWVVVLQYRTLSYEINKLWCNRMRSPISDLLSTQGFKLTSDSSKYLYSV